ncbi:hypothetical protein RHSIM_Rhsim09G0163700 [Rhododendron simsii]|uniref:Tify domain-containing protein n=1 Tax=Rhododendron simsii TaxID=118357 RepID=A0A834GG44_RHOSS|nr:hypothetical protein RHSIM_Rhsim09G0163700 [Rhododendron simsii]
MPRDAGCLADGDTNYDNPPRIDPKRPHQWLMDASELELFRHKRQEMEAVSSRPRSGIPNGSISLWDNPSVFQTVSGQFSDHLFGSDMVRTSNIIDRSIPTAGMGNLNAELKGFEDQLGIRSSVSLSMSHAIQDSSFCINYGGIRRVKVNQVGASDNGVPVSIGHPYSRGDNNLSIGAAYDKTDNGMSLGPTYDKGKGIAISMGPTFTKPNDNFVSMDHTFNKGDGSFMLMGHNFCKGYDNSLSISQPFDKGDGAFVSLGNGYEKGNASIMSASHDNKEHDNFISMVPTYNKDNGNFISVGSFYDKGDENSISMRPTSVSAGTYVIPRGTTNEKGNSGNMSVEENCIECGTGTNSFGDFQNEPEINPSGGMTSGYDLMANQPSVQTSAPGLENAAKNKIVAPAATAKTKATPKSKEPKPPKKVALNNNFPSNVKSLLSTGMLDGVPVKYVSWSRESLNAYELERHAGCKTKHPNNHIYFQNGKTIYAVVQELKNTPQEMLFEAIQTVTGSPINQKNFCTWKASYQAATRELQRIFGKDKLTEAS